MVRMGDASIRARQIPADSRYRLDDLSRTGCTSPDYYSLTSLYQVGGERRVARALSPAALSSRSLGQSRSVTPTKSDVTVHQRWLQDECSQEQETNPMRRPPFNERGGRLIIRGVARRDDRRR
jgi:hypothetical protein